MNRGCAWHIICSAVVVAWRVETNRDALAVAKVAVVIAVVLTVVVAVVVVVVVVVVVAVVVVV